MNSHQAKEILVLFRPGTTDRDDPEFAEALELVRRDPELGHWFEGHCAFQEALRSRFQQIPVPEGLKEQIISERTVRLSPPVYRRPVVVFATMVAALLLLAGSIYLSRPAGGEDKTLVGLRYRISRMVQNAYPKMDKETNDLEVIHHYLAQKGAGDYTLPVGLAKATATGCAVPSWQGNTMTMICYNSGTNGKPKNPDLFLFVIDQDAVRKAPSPESGQPQFAQIGRLATASWSKGGKLYVLGGLGDENFLRKFL